MKTPLLTFIVCFLTLMLPTANCQNQIKDPGQVKPPSSGIKKPPIITDQDIWPHLYDYAKSAAASDVLETYDSGYLITGGFLNESYYQSYAIILKTDINGNPLWERHFVDEASSNYNLGHTTPTSDGGSISIGSTTMIDKCSDYECFDAWIIKLDACGQKEWCKVYSVPMDYDFGIDIVQLDNGNFIAQINLYGYDTAEERIWLFCLSPDGDLLWQKVYLTSEHPQWATNASGLSLLKDNDGNLLFTGDCVVYDNYINPSNWAFQILHVKFSPEGEEIWGKAWHIDYDSNKYEGYYSAIDFNGNYVSGATGPSEECQCYAPSILRFTKDGEHISELHYPQGLAMYLGGGGAKSGAVFVDYNRMVAATQYWEHLGWIPGHNVVRLSDTLGNLLEERFLYDDMNAFQRIRCTTDNNVLLVAGFWTDTDTMKIFLYKLTPDLQYTPADTRSLVYDYLCPEAVKPMDTIFPDCDIIVGMEEPMHQTERYSLVASPNPASNQLTLTLPDRMLKEWESNGISSRTLYYTLPDNLQLQFTDALGRLHQTLAVAKGTPQVTVDVSRWPAGIYLARLTGGSTVVAEVKVVVR